MRRVLFGLSPVVAALALFACEDSGSGGGSGIFTTDGGSFEASPPSEAGPVGDGGGDAPAAKNVTVSIVRGAAPAAGVTVVFHDTAGAVLETKTSGADGKATSSDGITPVQATILLGGGGSRNLITYTALELGDEILVRDDADVMAGGTYAVTTQGTFADGGAENMIASIGECQGASNTSPIPVYLGIRCLRPTTAVLARAFGAPGSGSPLLAYAYAKGQAAGPTDGGTGSIAVGPWLAPTDVKVTLTNVPAETSSQAGLYEIADGLGIENLTAAITRVDPGTMFKVAPGFADAYQAAGRIFPNGAQGSTVTIAKRAAPSATVAIDFAAAPPTLDSATLVSTTVQRPETSWTTLGGASLATMDGGAVIVSWYDRSESGGTWAFVVPPGTTKVKAPAMPTAADPWVPHPPTDAGGAVTFNDPVVVFAEADTLPGYAAFRKGIGLVIPLVDQYQPDAHAILPSNGTLKLTSFRSIQR
ncbi:MAG TPA: hypothetical protein VLT33_41680 [Labilithrix sp.]|nr:hypothetical protein [Labilithrix sp.]